MSSLTSVSYFLLTTLFSLITFILWGRLFIRYFSISRFLPLSQAIYQLTNPVIGPIQQYILKGHAAKGPYDYACLALLAFCELLKFIILGLFLLKNVLPVAYLLFYVAVDMVVQPCNILFYAIIIRALISWFNPNWHNPFATVLIDVTEPILKAIRRILPDLGPIDFSPLVAIIALKVIELLLLGLLPFPLI